MVQTGGGNAKSFPRSPGMAASNAGDHRALQFKTRIGQADLSGISRPQRRICVFLFVEAEFRWRAQTLQAAAPGSAFAADARAGSNREMETGAIFSAGVGHRGGSAAARDSRSGTRIS